MFTRIKWDDIKAGDKIKQIAWNNAYLVTYIDRVELELQGEWANHSYFEKFTGDVWEIETDEN